MMIDYNGTVQLWEHRYEKKPKNKDLIEKKIKKLPHIELADGKLTFNENHTLTIIKISKAPLYKGKVETNLYRRLIRIETTGNGKIPKNITELLENQRFTSLV